MKLQQTLLKRSAWLRVILHLCLLTPLVYCVAAVLGGHWGGDPVQAIIHFFANIALRILLLTLVLAPLSRRLNIPALFRFRRLIGLYVAFYAVLHVLSYFLFDLGADWKLLWSELLDRPYIYLGSVALLLLLALSVSSFRRIQQRMGKRWLQLHGMIYPVSLMVVVHYWWSLKSGWVEPVIYFLVIGLLLSLRRKQLKAWLKSFIF